MNGQNPDRKEFNADEHRRKLISMFMDVRKMKDWADYSWQELSELAHAAIGRAEWFLGRKNYRVFGLYLRLYTDIWQYACDQLNPEDYQYFCCSQSSAAAAGIQ